MAKRFNVYGTFSNFLSERNLVANELAVVNTDVNYFLKSGLFCKGRLISKPQIPFAGVVSNIAMTNNIIKNNITNSTLYFLKDYNCFGIGTVNVYNSNSDTVSYGFKGIYKFTNNEAVSNLEEYNLTLLQDAEGTYRLVPVEDFDYYIYDRPQISYNIIGNPTELYCQLHTDYEIRTGDYILNDGTILPLELYDPTYNNKIFGCITSTKYRSFTRIPIIGISKQFCTLAIDQGLYEFICKSVCQEKDGRNVRDFIRRINNVDKLLTLSEYRNCFPALYEVEAYIYKGHIPTLWEMNEFINDLRLLKSLNNVQQDMYENYITNYGGTCTFAIDDKGGIMEQVLVYTGNSFIKQRASANLNFWLLGNY